MSDTIIRVENLGKKYAIAHQNQGRYSTLRDAIVNSTKSISRKLLNPFAQNSTNPTREEFWALKDVSFEVKQGDRVGIIGRNGAGKSTLLKLLSRITEPTTGRIAIKGRVASLLEVGTGFHPELTGRENIYLNGAVLGMNKAEIRRKFDEIVAFAEVEKFLDTPVKHYSSGMYVRLAFAVAAHLEPEILVVDEVLAVGDIQFQKKCLGKMESVSKGGRTIFFVSHNMAAIRALCNRAITLKQGQITLDTDTETGISHYLNEGGESEALIIWNSQDAPQTAEIQFSKAYVQNDQGQYSSLLELEKDFSINLEYKLLKPIKGLRIGFFLQNSEGVPICGSNDPKGWPQPIREPGLYTSRCVFPGHVLNAGRYSVYFGCDMPPYSDALVKTPYCLSFTIEDLKGHGAANEKLPGVVKPRLLWNVEKKNQSKFYQSA